MIDEAMEQLQEALQTDQALTRYMNRCRGELMQRVNNAAENGGLESLIIREREEREKSMVLMLNENERMNDVQMRKLVDRITESDDTENKVRLIRDQVASLHDYLDLLHADCLFGDEYDALFATFGDVELAVFAKIVFYEELRGDLRDFQDIVTDGIETENEWEMHYISLMQQLEDERLKTVGRLIYEIDYEEISFY